MKKLTLMLAALALCHASPSYAAEIFNDGFESGDLTHTDDSTRWGAGETGSGDTITVSTDDPHTGTYSLKFHFDGNASLSDDAWAEQNFILGDDYTEIYISYYIKFPSNFVVRDATGSDNNKLLVVWGDDYSTGGNHYSFYVAPNIFYPASRKTWVVDEWVLDCAGSTDSLVGIGDITNWSLSSLSLDEWHLFEFHFMVDDGTDTFAWQFWADDTLRISGVEMGLLNSPCDSNYINAGYLMGWANSGYNEDTDIYIDDVVFATTRIGSTPGYNAHSAGGTVAATGGTASVTVQ